MKTNNLKRASLIILGASVLSSLPAHAVGITFTYGAPGGQTSSVPGVVTEDFDDGSYASSPVGSWVGGTIRNADRFGGAGGNTKYLFANTGNPATLTFSVNQNYVGLWWSAGDTGNILDFRDASNNLLASFTINNSLVLLPPSYKGNPNPAFLGQNGAQAYAYLNFTNTGGNPIHSVVFRGSNFEIDNVSVTSQFINPPPNGGGPPIVPDGGSTIALLGIAMTAVAGARRKFGI